MRFLGKGELNDGGNAVVDVWTRDGAKVADPYSLDFEVFDKTTGTPTSIIARAPVDIANDYPTGDKIGVGHFAPRFTVPGGANKGLHEVRFYLRQNDGDAESQFAFDFDVLDAAFKPPSRVYALLSDVRAEDIPETQANDARVLRSLVLASQQIERFTDRSFGPQGKQILVDGRDSPDLLLEEPIIALEKIEVRSHAFGADFEISETDIDDLGVYNRHITQGLTDPDDRDNPKLSFFRLYDYLGATYRDDERPLFPNYVFPFGQQNVALQGVFGYTDPDGSPTGSVPELIRQACVLLAGRLVDKRFSGTSTSVPAGPIVEEKTRDQSVKYASAGSSTGGAAFGPFTGDPEIDNILLMYSRGTRLGAA